MKMRFNAFRFAKCRNAHLCSWSAAMNQQFNRGVYATAAAGGMFGKVGSSSNFSSMRMVMGEEAGFTNFAEQTSGTVLSLAAEL